MKTGDQIVVKTGSKASMLCEVVERGKLCRGCGGDIIWVKTPAGRMMPVDPPADDTDEIVSHFSTCPKAADFRRRA